MKPEHKTILRQVLTVATVGIVALVIWEIFKVIRAGQATIGKILLAPFSGLALAFKAITGLFSFDFSAPEQVTDDDTSGINDPNTGLPITGDNTLGGILMGFTPGGSTNSGWENWLAQIQQ